MLHDSAGVCCVRRGLDHCPHGKQSVQLNVQQAPLRITKNGKKNTIFRIKTLKEKKKTHRFCFAPQTLLHLWRGPARLLRETKLQPHFDRPLCLESGPKSTPPRQLLQQTAPSDLGRARSRLGFADKIRQERDRRSGQRCASCHSCRTSFGNDCFCQPQIRSMHVCKAEAYLILVPF